MSVPLLTDEELDSFEVEWNAGARFSGTIARWSPVVHRLIAALRASRAEVERLSGDAATLTACSVCGSSNDVRAPLVVRPFLVCSDHEYP